MRFFCYINAKTMNRIMSDILVYNATSNKRKYFLMGLNGKYGAHNDTKLQIANVRIAARNTSLNMVLFYLRRFLFRCFMLFQIFLVRTLNFRFSPCLCFGLVVP